MTDDDGRASRWGARLPAALLALAIIATAGVVLWILLSPPPGADNTAEKQKTEATAGERAVKSADAPEPLPGPKQHAKPVPTLETEQPGETEQTGETEPAGPSDAPKPDAAPPGTERPAGTAERPKAPDTAAMPSPAPPPSPAPSPAAVPDTPVETPPAARSPETAQPAAAPPLPVVMPRLPRAQSGPALSAAPDPGLVEQSPQGLLPVVGRDGREAWRIYARPFDRTDKRPKIAIVLYGIGPSASAMRAAIQGLPGPITLAFSPYADKLSIGLATARAAGHETLLMIPMEPSNYPQFDPGPKGLLTSLKPEDNVSRLEWMLARTAGYVGVTSFMGSRFTREHRQMSAILQQLRRRGLLYLESRTTAANLIGEIAKTARVPFAANALFIDQRASRPAIDSQLQEIERLAQKLGQAIGMAYPYPVTLERLSAWSRDVGKRGFVLAPVSALTVRAP